MKLEEIKANPRNPRKISEQKLAMLAKSIKEFGDLSGLIYNKRDQTWISGHQRNKILPQNLEIKLISENHGFVEFEGNGFHVRIVDWAPEKAKAATIAANKHSGDWDMSALPDWILELDQANWPLETLGFDQMELANMMAPIGPTEGLIEDDEVPEVQEDPKTKLGDLYQLGEHRLLCGDSTDILMVEKLMNGEKAELCFTSPPYSDQREYNGGKELSTEHLATFIRTSSSFTSLYAVNLGLSRKESEINQYWDDYIKEAKANGFKFLSWNVWNRQGSGFSIGNATAMFPIEHEFIFVFGEKRNVNKIIPNKSAGRIDNHTTNRQSDGSTTSAKQKIVADKRPLGTVLHLNMEMDRSVKHPAMFPVAFPETYISALTQINESVYEPFGGSGSTLIACEKTKRKCFMMELDPHYCSVIIERWCKYTGKEAYLVNADGSQTAWTEVKTQNRP